MNYVAGTAGQAGAHADGAGRRVGRGCDRRRADGGVWWRAAAASAAGRGGRGARAAWCAQAEGAAAEAD